jgi:hypothetical protein
MLDVQHKDKRVKYSGTACVKRNIYFSGPF